MHRKSTSGKNKYDNIPVLDKSRLVIFIGAYGSGKSETAINSAIYMSKQAESKGKKMILADLDVINPFYRSSDARKVLEGNGIQLITSQFANTNVEAPSVPPEVMSVFDEPDIRAVLDIGGEDMGARIVAALKNRITSADHELLMVINTKRPFTSTVLQVIRMKTELEEACGIAITGLVNNTNLLDASTPLDIHGSDELIREVSEISGIPYVFAAGILDQEVLEEQGEHNDRIPFLKMRRTVYYVE